MADDMHEKLHRELGDKRAEFLILLPVENENHASV